MYWEYARAVHNPKDLGPPVLAPVLASIACPWMLLASFNTAPILAQHTPMLVGPWIKSQC